MDNEAKKRIELAEEKGDLAPLLVEMFKSQEQKDAAFTAKMGELAEAVKKSAASDEVSKLAAEVKELGEKAQAANAELLALQQKFSRKPGAGAENKSIGATVAGSEELKAMAEGRAVTARVSFKSFERKDMAVSSDALSAGTLVQPQRLPGILADPDKPLLIRDLLMPGTTTSNAIEYVQEKLFTNNAAPVKELTLKPQSDVTFEMKDTTVKTLAHWMWASKQILADAPQLASYINGRLMYGLKYVEEQQLLYGDGTGQNLLGIVPQSTPYDTDLEDALNISDKNKMDVLRVAMLQVQLALYPPSGIVLHPTDWAAITLVKDNMGNYLIANPQSTVSQLLWSLPIVASMNMDQGTFLVGAFRLGAQIFDREQANIAISFEDRDNFIRNAVTIRAEERLALAVYRPAAFVFGSFA